MLKSTYFQDHSSSEQYTYIGQYIFFFNKNRAWSTSILHTLQDIALSNNLNLYRNFLIGYAFYFKTYYDLFQVPLDDIYVDL